MKHWSKATLYRNTDGDIEIRNPSYGVWQGIGALIGAFCLLAFSIALFVVGADKTMPSWVSNRDELMDCKGDPCFIVLACFFITGFTWAGVRRIQTARAIRLVLGRTALTIYGIDSASPKGMAVDYGRIMRVTDLEGPGGEVRLELRDGKQTCIPCDFLADMKMSFLNELRGHLPQD
jgi:hypothetical protein